MYDQQIRLSSTTQRKESWNCAINENTKQPGEVRKIFQGILKQIISKSGSRRVGADGEEQPQHVLVWGVSQQLVVDHGGARRCFLSLLISFQNSLIGIFLENSLTAVSKPI